VLRFDAFPGRRGQEQPETGKISAGVDRRENKSKDLAGFTKLRARENEIYVGEL